MNVRHKIFLIILLSGSLSTGRAQEVQMTTSQNVKSSEAGELIPLPYARNEMGQRYNLMDCIEVALEENFS
ncbi:MAG: hypothetical protein FWD56_07435, partial [Bacteroidales bacterium]|nr:hypothetical protein [Bacteroidales bacterium]